LNVKEGPLNLHPHQAQRNDGGTEAGPGPEAKKELLEPCKPKKLSAHKKKYCSPSINKYFQIINSQNVNTLKTWSLFKKNTKNIIFTCHQVNFEGF